MFYVNGSYVDDHQAVIATTDLGLVRGYGVFEYLRTYQGSPFHLSDHLARLRYSAHQIGLTPPKTDEEIEIIIDTLLRENGYAESGIKIVLTGGESCDQFTPDGRSSIIVMAYPHKPPPEVFYRNGISVVTTSLQRSIPESKTLHYTPAIIALKKATVQGAQEALYLNAQREILEATTSNFFAIKGNVLITPENDEVLLGITREVILRLAEGQLRVEKRTLCYDEIRQIDEAFITASNKEVMPVVKIDQHEIGHAHVGPLTRWFMEQFRVYTQLPNWCKLNILRYTDTVSRECH